MVVIPQNGGDVIYIVLTETDYYNQGDKVGHSNPRSVLDLFQAFFKKNVPLGLLQLFMADSNHFHILNRSRFSHFKSIRSIIIGISYRYVILMHK